jgi:hypothetical protein
MKIRKNRPARQMGVRDYFHSLSDEVGALRDRVRFLIGDKHWPTDGEWKESAIRAVLRRHLPATALVGRGFVVAEGRTSTQIDILIHDADRPVLFRDGDLVIVTPDAVAAILEVKASADAQVVREASGKLADVMDIVRHHPNPTAVAGLFAYEQSGGSEATLLKALVEPATSYDRRVDFACIGPDTFLRYWHFNPQNSQQMYQSWQAYCLRNEAFGYFIHNVIDGVSPSSVASNLTRWFPKQGKERGFMAPAVEASWKKNES